MGSGIKLVLTAVMVSVTSTALAQKVQENAIMNSDGSRTILRSQQLPDANERRARWCAERGGVDVTNEGDLTLSAGAEDAVVCAYSGDQKAGFSGAYIPKKGEQMPNAIAPDPSIRKAPSLIPEEHPAPEPEDSAKSPSSSFGQQMFAVPSISVFPNGGYTIAVSELFWPASYAIFHDYPAGTRGSVKSEILQLNCNWLWQGNITEGRHQVDGFVACTGPAAPGVVQTKMEACAGLCARGTNSFVVVPRS